MAGNIGVCTACGQEHGRLRLTFDGVTVIVSCPFLTSVAVTGADDARYEEIDVSEVPMFREPELDVGLRGDGPEIAIARKVRLWLCGAGAFGVLVGFAVNHFLG